MNRSLTFAAVVTGSFLTGSVFAVGACDQLNSPRESSQTATAAETQVVEGKIQSVNAQANEFVIRIQESGEAAGEKDVTIRVNERTLYTLDGQPSNMHDALKSGRSAIVTHESKLASKVEVSTKEG